MKIVADQRLREGYRRCARLTREHGTTYFWGAALLPRSRRRHVHAIYALCRLADDIVDDVETVRQESPDQTASRLQQFVAGFRAALQAGDSDDPVLAAVINTVVQRRIDPECFDRFFGAMAMDLTTTSYQSWADLVSYMEGSAAVIGEMMLPVLQPSTSAAYGPARALGQAFQLTNFLRDVAEDLDRGRVYLPQEDLVRFGVDISARTVTPQWRDFMAFQIERNRELYRLADDGIAMLPTTSARCVAAAGVLYARILDRIEEAGMDVFSYRLRVPGWQKAAVASRIMITGPPATPMAQRRSLSESVRASQPPPEPADIRQNEPNTHQNQQGKFSCH